MRLTKNLRRIGRFFWHRRSELLSRELWSTVSRVGAARFRLWDRLPEDEFRSNLAVLEERPWNLHVELSNVCNANCVFCAYQHQTRPRTVMSDAVYAKALDDYVAMGGGELMLEVTVGDPLTDAAFVERVRQARSRPEISRIATITNGIALDRAGVPAVVRSGLSEITISTGPWDRDLYTRIYRTSAAKYERMRANVRELLEENERAGRPLEVRLAFRTNLSMKETLALPDYAEIRQLAHTVEFNADFDSWTGEITQDDLLPGMRVRPQSRLEREACYWLYDGPIVYVDGKVGLCGCRDFDASSELVVGDLSTESLASIWKSERTRELRARFTRGHFPDICSRCTTYANLDLYRTSEGTARAREVEERLAAHQRASNG